MKLIFNTYLSYERVFLFNIYKTYICRFNYQNKKCVFGGDVIFVHYIFPWKKVWGLKIDFYRSQIQNMRYVYAWGCQFQRPPSLFRRLIGGLRTTPSNRSSQSLDSEHSDGERDSEGGHRSEPTPQKYKLKITRQVLFLA